MEYYLATIKVAQIEFDVLVKAKSFEEALKIANREYSMENGYRINLKVTLQ
tara:strand:- start:680 stop:832 length:153 start_codon:yes stop_codon:yes gene_type:complete